MSGYLGSWKVDDLLSFVVNTQVFATGVATDADAVPAYRVYEDETTAPILTGTMALLDSANTAGFYSEQITLSAANGFEKGKSYNIYISATVSSVAGATSRTFQMEAEVDANTISGALTTYTGNTVQTGDSFARIGATGSGLTSLASQASVTTIDDFLDSEIAAILAAVDTEVAAIKAVTDLLTLTAIADAILDRNMATGTDSGSTTVRTMRQALRVLRNKVDLATTPGTMDVKKEDDTTSSWTAALTTNAAAEPITIVDPAGP